MRSVHESFCQYLPILRQLKRPLFASRSFHFKILPFRVLILLFVFFLALSSNLHAKNNFNFEHVSVEQGLSHSTVLSILQDKTGFLWFGTFDGLNRYDGKNFKVYKYDFDDPNSLSDSAIWSIFEDSAGILWIGTQNGGLNRYDPEMEMFSRYRHDPDDPTSISHNTVRSICEDQSGKLWIGTREGGVNRFDPETGKFTRYINDPDDPESLSSNLVLQVYVDRSGRIWVGTMAGLNRFNPETGRFTRYVHDPNDPESLSHDKAMTIHEDSQGLLWIGMRGGGLNRFDPNTGKSVRYMHDPDDPESLGHDFVVSMYEDSQGMLWIGTKGGGVNRFNPETGKFTRFVHEPDDPGSLSNNDVYAIYEDFSGVIWFGTGHRGLSRLDLERKKFCLFQHNPNDPNSLCNNAVWSMAEDRSGMIWVGTEDGLDRFDPESGLFTHFRNNPNDPNSLGFNRIKAITEDRSGGIWIGTDKGLDRFDPKTEKFTHYKPNPFEPHSLSHDIVMNILEDASGMIWAGTFAGGLNRLNPETGRFTRYMSDPDDPGSLGSNTVMSIYEDRSGVFWAGTFGGGLNRFDPEAGKFRRFLNDSNDPKSLSHNAVASIYEDTSGVLWVGTYGGGLNRFDRKNETFIRYSKKQGLPNDTVVGIQEDNAGNLWLSTHKGLSNFNPTSITFKNYDKSDGLQSDLFNGGGLKTRNGEIFLPGPNGFNAFYPRDITDNPHVPKVVLTDFRLINRSVPIGEGPDGRVILDKTISVTQAIELTHRDDIIHFEFAALHFASPEKNKYAYIMEGFESEWNHVGNRNFATYTNLPSGKFIFRVKASNNDGIWNEEGTSMAITVIPPFWQTWWFRSLAGAVTLFLFIAVYRIRTESIRKRNLALEKYNLQLNEQIRERILAEQALRESESDLKKAQQLAHVGSWELNLKENSIEFSDELSRIYGVEPEKRFTTDTALEMIVPEDRERTIKALSEVSSEGKVDKNPRTFRFRRTDGEIRWVVSTPPEIKRFGKDGQPEIIIGTIQDITEQKLAEKALRMSERNYRELFESLEDGFMMGDLTGQIIEANLACVKMWGYSKEELKKARFEDLMPEKWVKRIEKIFTESVIKRGYSGIYESELRRKDGSLFPVESQLYIKKDDEGNPVGYWAIFRDLTERKMTQEIMIQTEKMLSVGGLAAGMAHEIKNPLGGIVQTAQVLRNRMFGDLTKNKVAAEECGISMEAMRRYMDKRGIGEMVDAIMESGNRAARIIENMLSFSRKSDYKFAEHDLRALLDRTVEIVRNDYDLKKKFDFRQIEIHRQYSASVPEIQCEGSEIQQVYLNILKNGAEAMYEAGTENPRFTLSVRQEEDKVLVEIEDNGPGMDEETKKHIFEPFFTTKEAGKGTGLGMSVSHYIITENHGGTIHVESARDKGTKFVIGLPFETDKKQRPV